MQYSCWLGLEAVSLAMKPFTALQQQLLECFMRKALLRMGYMQVLAKIQAGHFLVCVCCQVAQSVQVAWQPTAAQLFPAGGVKCLVGVRCACAGGCCMQPAHVSAADEEMG